MEAPKTFRDKRPWGEELWISNGGNEKPAVVKILIVSPGEELSLQYHKKRDEFWHILSGNGSAIIGEKRHPLNPGDELFVTRGTKHRLSGGSESLKVLELSFGDVDEKDIVRLEDKYGRA